MSWQLASFAILAVALAAGFAWYERSRPSSRTVALVATLAALATLGRVAFAPLPNVKPTTDIVLIAGYVLGGAPGFMVGAVSAIASNVVFSEGPWTPWQMLGWGLVGIAGGALALTGRPVRRVPMAVICGLAGFAFGFVVDLYTWLGFSSHTFGQYLVVEGAALPFNVAHAAGNVIFFLAFGPPLVRALQRFRLRMNVEWGLAGGLPLIAVLAAVTMTGGAAAPPARAAAAALDAPVAYLEGAQNADGGFGMAPGESSSPESTSWAIIGLAAAHRADPALARAVAWTDAHLAALQGPGDIERTILALAAARAPFAGLVGRLERVRSRQGSVGGQANLTAFAILALRAAGTGRSLAPEASWLARQQNRDGGFSFDARGDPSDIDDTAGALEALVVASAPRATIARARRYLLAQENADGGFPLLPGGDSNTQSTAWAAQALVAARGPVAHALRYLSLRITASGAVQYAAGVVQTPVWVTAEALAALARAPLPVRGARAP